MKGEKKKTVLRSMFKVKKRDCHIYCREFAMTKRGLDTGLRRYDN